MTTALKAINGGSKQRSDAYGNPKRERNKQADADKSIRPHCKVSIEDINWVRQQPPCVQQLWLDSIAAEQFGGNAHKLDTNLTYKSLQKAGAALTAQGLFQFEEVFGRLPSGRPGLIGYRVRNLHGYYNRFYWESSTSEETDFCEPLAVLAVPVDGKVANPKGDQKTVQAEGKVNQPEANQNHPGVEQIPPDLEQFQKNGQKTEELQGFQKPNNVSNYPLTTYQQPTKVVGKVVSSSTPNENSRLGETAIAPLGGASPPHIESASEQEKDSPTANDCTSLTLVDATPSQSVSLSGEKQDLGVEPEILHEDTYSAAPVAQNENCPTQAQGQVEQNQPASFTTLNSVSGEAAQVDHEGYCSAAPVPQPEKWSSEAIAARSKARPWRMEKLKMAGLLKENPGFDFLMECWNDDPALQIMIKGLVRKCSQWGYVVVDGELMEWERE